MNKEYRSFSFEKRDAENGGMTVSGKPVVFNSTETMYEIEEVQFREVIAPGALDKTDMSDVVFNVDHSGKPAAKTKNGTLTLELRSDGLYMNADLSKNATGRELYEDISNQFYDKMSFAFTVSEESYDRSTHTRTISGIGKIYDVSAVTWPAYQNTSISARSFFETEAERERLEKRERQKRKIKILMLV